VWSTWPSTQTITQSRARKLLELRNDRLAQLYRALWRHTSNVSAITNRAYLNATDKCERFNFVLKHDRQHCTHWQSSDDETRRCLGTMSGHFVNVTRREWRTLPPEPRRRTTTLSPVYLISRNVRLSHHPSQAKPTVRLLEFNLLACIA